MLAVSRSDIIAGVTVRRSMARPIAVLMHSVKNPVEPKTYRSRRSMLSCAERSTVQPKTVAHLMRLDQVAARTAQTHSSDQKRCKAFLQQSASRFLIATSDQKWVSISATSIQGRWMYQTSIVHLALASHGALGDARAAETSLCNRLGTWQITRFCSCRCFYFGRRS